MLLSAVRRLVVTESVYFRTPGTRGKLVNLGVEKFQVDLPIDSRSCEVCRAMNGRIFPISEFKIGLNAPPFHPNCENGGIIPVVDEDFEAKLMAYGNPTDSQSALEEREFAKDGLTNAKNGGIIKSTGDLKINSQPHDIASDLRGTNPNYPKGGLYKTNCGNCAVAYELRRRGYDVEAMLAGGSVGGEILSMFKGFIALKPNGNTKDAVVGDLIKTALGWGENARGLVYVQWKYDNLGHYFSIEVLNNKVRLVDLQSAKQDVSDYFGRAVIDKILFGRTDNLELDETILNAVTNKE